MKRDGSIDRQLLLRCGWAVLALLVVATATAGPTEDALLRCRGQADVAGRLACYDAITMQPASANAAASTAVATSTPPQTPTPTAAFGLESRQQPDAVDEVSSQLIGRFEGWGPGARFTLANGQVWEVSDGSSGIYDLNAPKATVRRAVMGTFKLEIDGAGKSPRVRRVQ